MAYFVTNCLYMHILQLLNEKNDDDDIETKVGLKNRSELLQQLLKDEDRKAQENTQSQSQDDTLLQSLGFSTSVDPGRARKRPSDEREEDIVPKRPTDSVQVSSSGTILHTNVLLFIQSSLQKYTPTTDEEKLNRLKNNHAQFFYY